MAQKSPDAYRTISEVSSELDVKAHVLRFWENKFPQISPMKRGGKRRYYTPDDVVLLHHIKDLLYNKRYTIEGVQKILKDKNALQTSAVVADEEYVSPSDAAAVDKHPAEQRSDVDFEALERAVQLLSEAELRIDSLSARLSAL